MDETPIAALSSRPTSPTKRHRSPDKANIEPVSKRPFMSTMPPALEVIDHDTRHSDEEELVSAPKKDKGKGKLKVVYVPELPEEIWARIFELYYEDCTNEWNSSNFLRRGLTPLLISKQHARMAIPILYRHPFMGYRAISPFISAIQRPSRYTDLPKQAYIKHLTVRPSPIIPALEFPSWYANRNVSGNEHSSHFAPFTIHPSFFDLMRTMPDLTSFTLKDTLVLHEADATLLFSGLRLIEPRKARLEFRLWDLYDSPFGPDLIAASGAGVHTPYAGRPVASLFREHPMTRAVDGCRMTQQAWKYALFNNTELEMPTWWIEPNNATAGGNQGNGNANANVNHNPPIPIPNYSFSAPPPSATNNHATNYQQQQYWQSHQQQNRRLHTDPSDIILPATTNQTSQFGMNASQAISERRFLNPRDAHIDANRRARRQLVNSFNRADTTSGETRLQSSVALTPSGPRQSMTETTISLPPRHGQTAQLESASDDLSADEFQDEATFMQALQESLPSLDTSVITPTLHSQSSAQGLRAPQFSHADANSISSTLLAPAPATLPQSGPSWTRLSRQGQTQPHLPTRATTWSAHNPSRSTSTPQESSSSTRWTATGDIASAFVGQPVGENWINTWGDQSRPTVSWLKPPKRDFQLSTPVPSYTSPDGVPMTNSHGLTSYSLAHNMRNLLCELIAKWWSPRLQAFSFVALDPLASLIVRSPAIDFWTQIAVPHIRVHLPRGINSLALFMGPKEILADRQRRRREEAAATGVADEETVHAATTGPNPPTFQTPSGTTPTGHGDDPVQGVIGGDGAGGGLINEIVRLFEVEINTMSEMRDDIWIRCGSQLPPQLCRILAGSHDWREVGMSGGPLSPLYNNYELAASPSTSGFNSPTFSFVTMDSDEDDDGDVEDFDMEGGEGSTYDRAKAEEQAKRMAERE
ncbi:hypothetical protein CI109_102342 [Kwoniella shandongensis]|uniref:Uncharacterized protein n=1 Tax=Kwoniella shandongensis TaxID=1734106 RepID=A0A5M6C5I0_9TREE|nr:uncharacterized protein CI109_003339 [Kwoniella shandongensis]KAA5528439.1 hypothetical protein CI109_003339 [Kwoniella shandongensis]